MAAPNSRLRAQRTIRTSTAGQRSDAILTIFVGLYNAQPYLDGLLPQIEAQAEGELRWLIVDNASSDDTWERISAWTAATKLDVVLVRNATNVGGTGTLFMNVDLVTTPWLAFMHQDDFYLPEHAQTLVRGITESPEGTVGVFSDMGRTDSTGRTIGSFPPPIWLVPSMDQPTVFLALLRNHCIPWPTMAVRTQAFLETEAPWHSTAFPDTEITMRLCARGTFHHVTTETMRYRDNSTSESRSIDDRERKFGAAVSLLRVFASEEFPIVAGQVGLDDRPAFVHGLKNSVLARLGQTERAYLVIVSALERLALQWDDEPTVRRELSSLYAGLGAHATASLLHRLSGEDGTPPPPDAGIDRAVAVTGDHGALTTSYPGLARAVSRVNATVGPRVPYRVRRVLSRLVIRSLTSRNPVSPWNFGWR